MTKLVFPSVHRATIAFVLQSLRVLYPAKKTDALVAVAISSVKDVFASATPQQRIASGLDIEDVASNIGYYASHGDTDLLEAYSKFSIVEFPFMPLAVGHLRAALGKYKVIDLLTPEHLEVHDRAARLFAEIHEDLEGNGIERDADELMKLIYSNFDRADDICAIMQERRITSPKEIAYFIEDRRVTPALAEGTL